MLKVQTGAVKILKNNVELPASVLAAIQNVRVQDEINVPAMFSFTLNIVSSNGNWQDVDLDSFKPGDQIVIMMGLDRLEKIISGEITAVEPSFNAYATATVRGFDRMYRLKFGTTTTTYQNLNDNEIVQEIARTLRMQVKLPGSPETVNKYILQNNQSYYDFLMQRCEQLNYELLMEDTTLVFRPSAEGNSPVKSFTYPADIDQVDLRLKVPTIGDKVTVVSYDITSNKVISAEASSGTPQDKMGGQQTGYETAQDFPSSGTTLERPNITDIEALQAVADAQYQRYLNSFIEGGANIIGDPDLTAGVNIKLGGLSSRFDGTYYITSSTHSYDDSSGYKTEIQLRRTGI